LVVAVVKKKKKEKRVQTFDPAPSSKNYIKKKIQKKSSKGFLDLPLEEPKPAFSQNEIKKKIHNKSSKGFLNNVK
jgi:hypothetical protein